VAVAFIFPHVFFTAPLAATLGHQNNIGRGVDGTALPIKGAWQVELAAGITACARATSSKLHQMAQRADISLHASQTKNRNVISVRAAGARMMTMTPVLTFKGKELRLVRYILKGLKVGLAIQSSHSCRICLSTLRYRTTTSDGLGQER
jgi:hypothetical protein